MICKNCKKDITSKQDLVITYWGEYRLNFLIVYDKKCFNNLTREQSFGYMTPGIVYLDKLKLLKMTNVSSLAVLAFLLIYALTGLRNVKDWLDFLDLSILGTIILLISAFCLALLIYIPLRNLKIIIQSENLAK